MTLPGLSNLVSVSDKAERRAARSVVAEYHEAELRALVVRVGEAVDRHRAGEIDAFDVDRVLFHYSRAAKELWKFCNLGQVETAAAILRDRPPHATVIATASRAKHETARALGADHVLDHRTADMATIGKMALRP